MNTTEVEAVVNAFTADRLISFGGTGLSITTDPADATTSVRGDYLKVIVTYEYDFLLLPALAQNLLPTLTLRAETIMRAE